MRLADRSRQNGARAPDTQDVLRSAAVFLYASLEEYFRRAIRATWPTAGREVLDDVPLVGTVGARPVKFALGDLAQFRRKSVQEVIAESVDAYSNVFNLNNANDLASFLRTLKVDPTKVNGHFAQVESLMKRRHHIVHQADRSTNAGSGNHGGQVSARRSGYGVGRCRRGVLDRCRR